MPAVAAIALLTACNAHGGNALPPGTGGGIAAPSLRSQQGSWMTPDAKSQALLYVSDFGTNDIYVFSFPNGKLVGTLTGFDSPGGECVDASGNVFITNEATAPNILEYAHGGTTPIATLSDPAGNPLSCSIDPVSGDLAVANTQGATSNAQGNVAIYRKARGKPKVRTDLNVPEVFYCGYDDAGNLFIDGENIGSSFEFAELPVNGRRFKNITLQQRIGFPGSVQWDGKNVTVADAGSSITPTIYRFAIEHAKGDLVGTTLLDTANDIGQTWITPASGKAAKQNVVAAESGTVGIWKYPAGKAPLRTLTGFTNPFGVTVSYAQ
jgi:hypothetical protein